MPGRRDGIIEFRPVSNKPVLKESCSCTLSGFTQRIMKSYGVSIDAVLIEFPLLPANAGLRGCHPASPCR
jgi:hypothetical protein